MSMVMVRATEKADKKRFRFIGQIFICQAKIQRLINEHPDAVRSIVFFCFSYNNAHPGLTSWFD